MAEMLISLKLQGVLKSRAFSKKSHFLLLKDEVVGREKKQFGLSG